MEFYWSMLNKFLYAYTNSGSRGSLRMTQRPDIRGDIIINYPRVPGIFDSYSPAFRASVLGK